MDPSWRQKHTGVKRNAKCSPTASLPAKLLLTFSRPLENLKHWKIIFCRLNKETSSQMGIFMETDFRQLLKRMFPLKLQVIIKLYEGIVSLIILSELP